MSSPEYLHALPFAQAYLRVFRVSSFQVPISVFAQKVSAFRTSESEKYSIEE